MTEQTTVYKLMVLYMLSRIDFSLTNTQISDFVLGKGYTDYFTLQSSLSELEESNLVHLETISNTTYYTITPEGEETITYFVNKVSQPIRDDIDHYLIENRVTLRNETSVIADYYKNTAGDIAVRCRVKEKDEDLIDLTLTVPDVAQAKAICAQWKKKSQPVYEYLMKELMQ